MLAAGVVLSVAAVAVPLLLLLLGARYLRRRGEWPKDTLRRLLQRGETPGVAVDVEVDLEASGDPVSVDPDARNAAAVETLEEFRAQRVARAEAGFRI